MTLFHTTTIFYINPKSREPILAIDGMLIEIRKPSHAPSLPVLASVHTAIYHIQEEFHQSSKHIHQPTNITLMRMEESPTNKTMHNYDLIDFNR